MQQPSTSPPWPRLASQLLIEPVDGVCGFGRDGKPEFWLGERDAAGPVHVAFASDDRLTVDAFYEAAMAAGATDNGGARTTGAVPPALLRRIRARPGRQQRRGRLPPADLGQTGEDLNNRIVHFEIPAENPKLLANFDEELFGWKISKAEGVDDWIAQTGEEGEPGIDGAITGREAPEQCDQLRGRAVA